MRGRQISPDPNGTPGQEEDCHHHPFGLYIYKRTPFGPKNAGQDFQRLMDGNFDGIPHIFVYLDDILVASTSPEEHLRDLKVVFKILNDNGLVV